MSKEVKRLDRKYQELVDYVMLHPELSETACIEACGWANGSVGKILEKVRPHIDARKAKISASIDKKIVKDSIIGRVEVMRRMWELANLDPEDTNKNISGQVKATSELAEILGMKVSLSADLSKEFEGKTEEQLEHFAVHGYWPLGEGSTSPAGSTHGSTQEAAGDKVQ